MNNYAIGQIRAKKFRIFLSPMLVSFEFVFLNHTRFLQRFVFPGNLKSRAPWNPSDIAIGICSKEKVRTVEVSLLSKVLPAQRITRLTKYYFDICQYVQIEITVVSGLISGVPA